MISSSETSPGSIESAVALGAEYLRKIKDSFDKLHAQFRINPDEPSLQTLAVNVRLNIQAFNYWTEPHSKDPRIAKLYQDVQEVLRDLERLETRIGFDFNRYQLETSAKAGSSFTLLEKSENGMHVDYNWFEYIHTVEVQFNNLLNRVKRAHALGRKDAAPQMWQAYTGLIDELENAIFLLSGNAQQNDSQIRDANNVLNSEIVAEIGTLLNQLLTPEQKQHIDDENNDDDYPPAPALFLLELVSQNRDRLRVISPQVASFTTSQLRNDPTKLQQAKHFYQELDEMVSGHAVAVADVESEIAVYSGVAAPNAKTQRLYAKHARDLRENYVGNSEVVSCLRDLTNQRDILAGMVFFVENPELDGDFDALLLQHLTITDHDIEAKSDAELIALVENINSKIAALRAKVSTNIIATVSIKLQSTIDELEVIAAKAAKVQKERAHQRHELLEKSAATLAVEFFDGGHVVDYLPNFRNKEWLKETPTKLASALFHYIEWTVMEAQTSGNNAFVKMSIFNWHLTFSEHTVSQLIESFGNLGLLYPDQPEKTNEFKELNGKLAIDFARIEQIHALGKGVNDLEQLPDAMFDFLISKDNRIEHELMRKIARIGYGYQDKEGLMAQGGKLFYAQLAWLFLHDPIIAPLAVYEDTPDEKPIFMRHAAIKSEFSVFPVGLELELQDNPGSDYQIKRMAVRLVAGSIRKGQLPPWTRDPRWTRKQNGGVLESLPELAARRQMIGREFMEKLLYGYGNSSTRDQNNKLIMHPKSLYARLENKIDEKTTDPQYLPTPAELQAMKNGFFAELQTSCLMEYYLMSAKAEGVKAKPGEVRFGNVPVLAAKGGPTAKFYVARIVASVEGYSRKLTDDEGGGEGSHVPIVVRDKFNRILLTFLDRYFFPPTGSDEVGVSLREQMYLCDTDEQYINLPFQAAITMGEKNVAWVDQLDMAKLLMGILFKGMGQNWHNVVASEPGSEGAVVTFNPVIAEKIKSTLSRNAYYLLTRDWGRQVHKWKTTEEYNQFRELELVYKQQKDAGGPIVKPATVGSRVVTQKQWEQVREFNRLPTARHRMVDGRNLSDKGSDEVVRIATNIDEFFTIPSKERDMNRFEKAVLLSPIDELTKLQILLVGTIFLGDVYRSESANSMSADDLNAFRKLFSRTYWDQFQNNPIGKTIMRAMSGRKVEEKYNGIGYFLPQMVEEMLAEAGVGTGPAVMIRSMIEKVQKFGA